MPYHRTCASAFQQSLLWSKEIKLLQHVCSVYTLVILFLHHLQHVWKQDSLFILIVKICKSSRYT